MTLKLSQRKRIKDLFEARPGQWIPLYDIFAIAKQYNARILELRRQNMNIINKTQEVEGVKQSWYKYEPSSDRYVNQSDLFA